MYVEVAALQHINTMWGVMSKAMGRGRVKSKRLGLISTNIAVHCSYHSTH